MSPHHQQQMPPPSLSPLSPSLSHSHSHSQHFHHRQQSLSQSQHQQQEVNKSSTRMSMTLSLPSPSIPQSSHHATTPYTPILPSDFSYFSPLAPQSASLPPSAISNPNSPRHQHSSSFASPIGQQQPQGHSQTYTYTASSSQHSQPSSSSSSDSSSSSGAEQQYPVITATITSRSPPPPPPTPDMLASFSLHFPPPPSLRMPSSHPSPPSPTQQQPKIVSNVPQSHSLPSPMDRGRRSGLTPLMTAQTSQVKHTLSVLLPKSIASEMVTVSANKGDRLKVVADAWHMEDDCHYEWIIAFQPHDVDMSSVHARFDPDGMLTIDVKRRIKYNMGGGNPNRPGGNGTGVGLGYFARA